MGHDFSMTFIICVVECITSLICYINLSLIDCVCLIQNRIRIVGPFFHFCLDLQGMHCICPFPLCSLNDWTARGRSCLHRCAAVKWEAWASIDSSCGGSAAGQIRRPHGAPILPGCTGEKATQSSPILWCAFRNMSAVMLCVVLSLSVFFLSFLSLSLSLSLLSLSSSLSLALALLPRSWCEPLKR